MEQEVISDISRKIRDFKDIVSNNDDFKKYTKALDELIATAERPLILMVMGEFSTGKSTFINALLGRELLQMNATPTTAVITKLCYGKKDEITVHYRNGYQESKTPREFLALTAESNGKTNEIHKEIDYVERRLPTAFLKDVNIIDSPGLNAIKEEHGKATRRFIDNADAIIWMLSAENAGSLTEIQAMDELPPGIKPIALVNKMDQVDEEEESPEELLDNIRGLLGDHVQQVIGISAEYALQGKLKNNSMMQEASGISAFYKVYDDVILSNAAIYKMNSILRNIAEFMYKIGDDFENIDSLEFEAIKSKTAPVIYGFKVLINSIWEYAQRMQENTATQVFRAMLYHFGLVVNKNEDNMLLLLKKAADKQDRVALTLLGQYYNDNDEDEKALKYLQIGANLGCVDCQALLADIYFGEKLADPVQSYNYAKLACEQNNTYGYLALGSCLLIGWGVKKDIDQAIKYLEKYEEMEPNGNGYFVIGGYYSVWLEPPNFPKAIYYFKKAIESGNKDALSSIGLCYYSIGNYELSFLYLKKSADYNKASAEELCKLGHFYHGNIDGYVPKEQSSETAFKYFKQAANMGNAEAQHTVAKCYFYADGVLENISDGIYWLKKSAENDCLAAQIELSLRYKDGDNIDRNEKEAFKWMNKATEHDDSGQAYNFLGVYYGYGTGEAVHCFQIAAERGYIWGKYNLGICYAYGQGITTDYAKAFKCFKIAAEEGLAHAQYELGECYEFGRGTEQGRSLELAIPWYKKAAAQGYEKAIDALRICKLISSANRGDVVAQFKVGEYYDDSNNVRHNPDIALEYLIKAAANGHAYAQYMVGIRYRSSQPEKACQWFANAANQGLPKAQYEYGRCLAYGFGTPKDIFQGKNWLQKAIEQGNEPAQKLLAELNRKNRLFK